MTNQALKSILSTVGLDPQSVNEAEITGGADPVLPTPFHIGETAAASLAAVGLAVSDLWRPVSYTHLTLPTKRIV